MDGMKIGPAGKAEGEIWDHHGRTQIVRIFISHGPYFVRSLQFQYIEDGQLVNSEIIGSPSFDGSIFDTFTFKSSEYITEVQGYYYQSIESICIKTNLSVYGSLGEKSPISHKYNFKTGPDNQFGGFHGTHDSRSIRSIGVYYIPAKTLPIGYTMGQLRVETGPSQDDEQVHSTKPSLKRKK